MKFLAIEIENEKTLKEDFKPLLLNEAEKVWYLYQNDTIREIYFDNERSAAVIIMECKDKEEAISVLSELPLVKNNLIYFEIYCLSPYPGFSRMMHSDISKKI